MTPQTPFEERPGDPPPEGSTRQPPGSPVDRERSPTPRQPPVDIQGRPLADWWKRVVAFVIDIVIVYAASAVIAGVAGSDAADIAAAALALVVQLSYFSFLNGSAKGQTVGKMALRISVRDMDTGGPIGPGRAFSRMVAQIVLALLFIVPWIIDVLWPLWDGQRQAWHDKAVRSLVVDVA